VPIVTWRSKPADRRTGEANIGHAVLELRPSRGMPMVQAVIARLKQMVHLSGHCKQNVINIHAREHQCGPSAADAV